MIQRLTVKVIESYHEEIKTIPSNFDEKNITCTAQNFYILFFFLLTIITLLIAVSIYCYLIKHHDTKTKQIYIGNINWKCVTKLKYINIQKNIILF